MKLFLQCTVIFLFLQILLPHAAVPVTDTGSGPDENLPQKPDILVMASGSEELSALFKTEIESVLIRSGFHTLSASQIPELEGKMETWTGSVKWYDVRQFIPEGKAHILMLVRIEKSGSMMLDYHGRRTKLHNANYTVTATDLESGRTVGPPLAGTVRYTQLNQAEKIKQAVAESAGEVPGRITAFWAEKLEKE